MLEPLLVFFVTILIAWVSAELFRKLNLPPIVGQIIAGIIIAFLFSQGYLADGVKSTISLLSELGIIFLLILTGLEIDLSKLAKSSKEIVAISFSSVFVPFIFGWGFGALMGYSWLISFVIGASLSLTAEATKAICLMQRKVLSTRLGEIMILAGTVDDIFEFLFLSALLIFAGSDAVAGLAMLPIEILAFIVVVWISLKMIPRVLKMLSHEGTDNYFTLTVILGLGMAAISNYLSIGPIIGALCAGIVLKKAIKSEKIEKLIEDNLRIITFALIIPFFYLQIGLNVDIASFFLYPWMILAVLLLGFFGKMIGALIAKPLTDLTWEQLSLVGWGMNSRGVIELVILELARQKIPGFPIEIYTAIVFMSIITTIAFPLALEFYLKRNPRIMA